MNSLPNNNLPPDQVGRKARIAAAVCVGLGVFTLVCLMLLDYDENCSIRDCAAVHHALASVYSFDYSYLVPIINSMPIPITLTLFVPCLALFTLILWSMVVLRSSGGFFTAILESFQVLVFAIILFEIGLYYLDPDWWTVHATNLSLYPFTVITNEMTFDIALGLLFATIALRAFIHSTRAQSLLRRSHSNKTERPALS